MNNAAGNLQLFIERCARKLSQGGCCLTAFDKRCHERDVGSMSQTKNPSDQAVVAL